MLEILEHYNPEQQQLDFSREKSILDLFCSNKPNMTKWAHTIPGLSDHEAICADCDIQVRTHKKPPRKIHQWSKADLAKIKAELCSYRDKFLEQCRSRSMEKNILIIRLRLILSSINMCSVRRQVQGSICLGWWVPWGVCAGKKSASMSERADPTRGLTGNSIEHLRKTCLKGLWHGQNYAYSFKHELQT